MKTNFFVSSKNSFLALALCGIFGFSNLLKGQTLDGAVADGLITVTNGAEYDFQWYSNRSTPFQKTVTISYSGFNTGDKITITGDNTDTMYFQVKSNVSGFTAFLDVTRWPGNSRNLCFEPGSSSGTVVLTFQRLGTGGNGTFTNNIDIEVANSSCVVQSGTGKSIRLNTTVTVDAAAYNLNSQATLSEWGQSTAWLPNRTSPSSSDILVFDNGNTDIDVKLDITNQTVKSIVLMPYVDVTFREEGSNGTITLSGGKLETHATSVMRTNGYDTLRFELTGGAFADINGDLICEKPTANGDKARLVFKGGGDIYFGGDVDVQTDNSLRVEPSSQNTIFFDGETQEFKGAGDVYFNYLTNVTVGVSGKSATPNSALTLRRGLPILGVLTLRNYATLANTSVPASSSASDGQSWMPDLKIKNDGQHRGRVATLGTNASITGSSYFEMYSNGIRTYRTIGFPIDNMHLSQITDDLIISGVYTGTNQDSMDRTCGYCKASSYLWDESNSAWDSLNSSSTPTKIYSGQGLLLFFRGLAGNGLGNPSASANAGNIDFKGTLATGTKYAILAKAGSGTFAGYNLIGNPYPCHIDFTKLTRTDVQNKFQVLDPTTKSYNVWNNTTGTLAKTGSTLFRNDANANIIEIGASFFAIADQNGGTIEFNEDDKITTEPAATAFRTEQAPIPCNQLHGSIEFATDTIPYMDMNILEWNATHEGVSANVDKYDADKFYGGYVAIGTLTPENNWLTMDYRPATGETKQTIPMSIRTMQKTAYKLTFQTCEDNSEYFVTVRDKQKDSLIEVGAETQYVFETTNGDKFENDRFEVIIENKTNSISKLKSDFEITAYPNPVLENSFRLLGLKNKQVLSVQLTDIFGKQFEASFKNGLVSMNSKMNAGTYIVGVRTNEGTSYTKIIIE